jgi:phosphoribosylformylglycinamidine cyclo-ligase
VLLGLESSGLHTNGYSLARKVLFDELEHALDDRPAELGGPSVVEALLAVHRSYYPLLWPLLERNQLAALAHVTGGGLVDNVPRVLNGCDAWIDRRSWSVPPLFRYLCERGRVERAEAYQVFNMGIGMVLFVAPEHERAVVAELQARGERVHVLGRTEPAREREGVVRWLDA